MEVRYRCNGGFGNWLEGKQAIRVLDIKVVLVLKGIRELEVRVVEVLKVELDDGFIEDLRTVRSMSNGLLLFISLVLF